MIIGTLGYFILPLDLLPDTLPFGLSDDELSLMAAISALASCFTIDIQNEAKEQLRKIFGDFDENSLDSVKAVIQRANDFINTKR